MIESWYLVQLLVLLVVLAVVAAAVLLIRGRRARPQASGDVLRRDREHLERLEAIDQRLERLEKTLYDLPS